MARHPHFLQVPIIILWSNILINVPHLCHFTWGVIIIFLQHQDSFFLYFQAQVFNESTPSSCYSGKFQTSEEISYIQVCVQYKIKFYLKKTDYLQQTFRALIDQFKIILDYGNFV